MRNLFRNLAAGIGIALSVLASASLSYAQVEPSTNYNVGRQPSPREFNTQQTAYIRATFAYNSCTQTSNTCTVKLTGASLPYNAAVLRVYAYVYTAFNSTSTDTITLGTTSANANEIVNATCSIHSIAVQACTVYASSPNNIGNTVTQSGWMGGLDLYMKWTGGGGTPSAGLMSLIIEYAMPNDGLCGPVTFGAAPAGC